MINRLLDEDMLDTSQLLKIQNYLVFRPHKENQGLLLDKFLTALRMKNRDSHMDNRLTFSVNLYKEDPIFHADLKLILVCLVVIKNNPLISEGFIFQDLLLPYGPSVGEITLDEYNKIKWSFGPSNSSLTNSEEIMLEERYYLQQNINKLFNLWWNK